MEVLLVPSVMDSFCMISYALDGLWIPLLAH